MLTKFTENMAKVDNLNFPQVGVVVFNEDPVKQGRVKCRIEGILEGEPNELPWCYPVANSFLGGSNDSGTFAVPEIGSKLVIQFLMKDIHVPFYIGYWYSEKEAPSEFCGTAPDYATDYPNCYGFQDSTGTKVVVNKTKGSISIKHGPSGSTLLLDKDGNLFIEHPGDQTVEVGGDCTWNVKGDMQVNVEGKYDLTTVGNVKIIGERIDLNP